MGSRAFRRFSEFLALFPRGGFWKTSATMAKPFRTKLKVRFEDVDRAGIAYFPRIVGYFHYAFEEFWEQYAKIPYHKLLDAEHLGFPNVHMEVDFLKALNFGDILTAEVSVDRVGRSSVIFHYRFFRKRTLCVDAKLTVVAVDMRTFKPRSIPQKYRKLFAKCGPG